MKIIFKILKELKHSLSLFLIGTILFIISSFSFQYLTIYVKYIIDNIITPLFNKELFDEYTLIYNVGMYVILTVIINVVYYISSICVSFSINNVIENIRNKAFDKIQKLPISYFDNNPSGKISTRIINNTETIRKSFYETLNQQFIAFVNVVSIYIIVFMYDYKIGFVLLFIMPFIVIWQRIYSKVIDKNIEKYYNTESSINSMVTEAINNTETIQIYSYENEIINEYNNLSSDMYNSSKKLIKADATLNWILVDSFKRIFIIIILSIVGYEILHDFKAVSVGFIFAYIDYSEKLFTNLSNIVRNFPNIQRSLSTGEKVFELLEEKEEENSKEEIQISTGDVEFKNVSFSYVDDLWVLKNINFKVKNGSTIALVGHTGSGKSSIINLLFRFYDCQKGEILIDNKNIKNYNRESIRKYMGIVLQDPYLFKGTIATNVSMGNENISEEIIKDSLIKVGASSMINKLKNGIYEEVSDKGNTYSSGEKQLISFARALASNPKILILDEATSHIDTETESIIQNAMNVVKQGRTTFIIAHRLSTIQNADIILVIDKGEIVESGTHNELINKKGYYEEMYNTQLKLEKNN